MLLIHLVSFVSQFPVPCVLFLILLFSVSLFKYAPHPCINGPTPTNSRPPSITVAASTSGVVIEPLPQRSATIWSGSSLSEEPQEPHEKQLLLVQGINITVVRFLSSGRLGLKIVQN